MIVKNVKDKEVVKKDVDKYFKYQLIEKWDGSSNLIISDVLIR